MCWMFASLSVDPYWWCVVWWWGQISTQTHMPAAMWLRDRHELADQGRVYWDCT